MAGAGIRRQRRLLDTVGLRGGLFVLVLCLGALGRRVLQPPTDPGALGSARRRLRAALPPTAEELFPLAGRRLAPADVCIACDEVSGGVLSITGALSGQCACDVVDGQCGPNSTTCCGSLDSMGGVIFYTFITLYTFLGLAIICDGYFCESLEKISTKLGLSDDVAGATFMAVGSSAPELFTAIVTTLITGGSEGIGTIVGSAIFNIMMIVGVTCMCAGQVLEIWWFPLCRDAVVYTFSVLAMYVVLLDQQISLNESIGLCLGYVGYIVLMVNNAQITRVVQDWEQNHKLEAELAARQAEYPDASIDELKKLVDRERTNSLMVRDREHHDEQLQQAISLNPLLRPAYRGVVSDVKHASREEERSNLREWQGAASAVTAVHRAKNRLLGLLRSRREGTLAPRLMHEVSVASNAFDLPENVALVVGHLGVHAMFPDAERNEMPLAEWPWGHIRNWELSGTDEAGRGLLLLNVQGKGNLTVYTPNQAAMADLERSLRSWKPGEWAADELKQRKPSVSLSGTAADAELEAAGAKQGLLQTLIAVLSKPLEVIFSYTVWDCSKPQYEAYYMGTFMMSIVWIGILSFVMVDFAGRAGCVVGIPGLAKACTQYMNGMHAAWQRQDGKQSPMSATGKV
eukprot:g1769.t1